MNKDIISATDERIENLTFRFNKLSEKSKNKFEGFLTALEQEDIDARK